MKAIFKIEIERAFRGIGMKIALLIGMGISIAHLILQVVPRAMEPLKFFDVNFQDLPRSVFNSWMGGNSNYEYQLFIRLIPILVVLPYGISFFTDMKTGIVKNYYTRMKKSQYLIAKYLSVFLSGGTVVVLPLILNLLVTSAVMPSLISPGGTFSVNANGMWSGIFYSHPYIYIIMYLILNFIMAGLVGCIALCISQLVNNRFVAMLFPFLLCEFVSAISRYSSNYIIRGMAHYRFFSISQLGYNYIESAVVVIIVLFVVGFGIFYAKGVKDDTL